jgi:hypothetical protein
MLKDFSCRKQQQFLEQHPSKEGIILLIGKEREDHFVYFILLEINTEGVSVKMTRLNTIPE